MLGMADKGYFISHFLALVLQQLSLFKRLLVSSLLPPPTQPPALFFLEIHFPVWLQFCFLPGPGYVSSVFT